MSEEGTQVLIALVRAVQSDLAALREELAEHKRLVNLCAANAELVYDSHRARGSVIEALQREVERLRKPKDPAG
ncbi:MAG: hypothetical protein KJN79_00195 [Gammaproteobacteria bacterium]|nr:hypothetical protein [Gammaproteobacteria bacterium]